ncbi:MAG: D-alanine--D-alanine ligase [Bdellovibrionales bacterium RIFOXYB1_FULL_37_110]|nr:MAG: D-alanine--D-alanine ligase [Bdellovibrionales bacterium RIFOXYA1_FULL_38_20]OFZ52577.1 MAG: D-alanine--D-alanine ligase [Bdellovibrionales bacterium RIFOXYC1_FULL_37_79]OFZ59779.1 MAG: D-alanine--D-alanine ligase [Bdellovibrionales bacterium RIFOXYB1_FULL_37_110]OFZ65314.1 MAG: D-alanine--D-alanine ligase [Bdellovibrionales bacterium RIFOXYD1_FULL_36_51]
MKKLKILVLIHPSLIPPTNATHHEAETMPWRTEHYVIGSLTHMGHQVQVLGVESDLRVIQKAKEDFKPHIAFNLLEQFDGETLFDHNVVSYLEMIKLPYTGCNPKGLILARDKSLSKKIMFYHRIKTPLFMVVAQNSKFKRPKNLKFPLFVKSLTEEGSVGISQNSIVYDDEKLLERIKFIHETTFSDAIIETYIEGTDLYISLMGNKKVVHYPLLELKFKNVPAGFHHIATSKVKWDPEYRKKYDIDTHEVKDLSKEDYNNIVKTGKKIYRALNLSGYARIDLRLTPGNRIYFLEANPNPDMAKTDDFAISAKNAGVSYEELLEKALSLGLSYYDSIC